MAARGQKITVSSVWLVCVAKRLDTYYKELYPLTMKDNPNQERATELRADIQKLRDEILIVVASQ